MNNNYSGRTAKMEKYKIAKRILRAGQIVIGLAVFVSVSGLISYFTANGHAVIGPDPASPALQKAAIKAQTVSCSLCLVVTGLGLCVTGFFLSRKEQH